MIDSQKSPRRGRPWWLAVAVALTLSSLSMAACYGSHSVIFVDSVRGEGQKVINDDLEDKKVPVSKCGPAGASRIEVYSSWWDMFVSEMTFGSASRSVDITCAGEN